jgi:ankyrin repeat protein
MQSGSEKAIALWDAVMTNDVLSAERAAAGGADVNRRISGETGRVVLHIACERCSRALIEALLRLGADCGVPDWRGWTPLHYAASAGNAGAVEVLIGKSVSVDAKDNDGNTPLHLASQHGALMPIKMLISRGADRGALNRDGRTAIMLAKAYGHDDLGEVLATGGPIATRIRRMSDSIAKRYKGSSERGMGP